ncbi:peptidoglycan binding domain containing protein [Metarhizium acridum CQMa 102]|uniref:Peptidoglycan binding domain containing protein n=1 Tax=Metarhizium acridum (strain CQMa 102) TaxID=655827 RepID=E9E802_METAQ|nr:peptidoglycan binding domain containing protein [Metarhizium acridum CQMa 102]EFY88009.1 peptidoglycan binding domain containing protein [Metarhizium acridum CQMa 102]
MTSECNACTSVQFSGNVKKRLIVCCDGTFSGVDKGTDDYSSNVARLCRVISNVGISTTGERIPQVVYYQSGVGTGSLTYVDKVRQGAFGGSLAENVCEAYNYLSNNWGPGDEIFIFGFSRGAYTARSLAGVICQVGLLTPLLMDNFFEIYGAYKNRGNQAFDETTWANEPLIPGELGTVPPQKGVPAPSYGTRLQHLRKVAHLHVKIKVVGVWDTVGSVGGPNWFGQAGEDTTFHSTKLSPRGHSQGSVDTNSIDEIAFSWMCDQLLGLLQLSGTALQKYILFRIGISGIDTKNKNIRDLSAAWKAIAWSDGELADTNSFMSMWWLPSLVSTARPAYHRIPGETKAYEKIGNEKKRIPYKQFNEEVHPSVIHRVKNRKGYMPGPFAKDWKYVEPTNGARAYWVKGSGEDAIVLNEYLIPKLEGFDKDLGYDHWLGSLERTFAPKDVVDKQDAVQR